jgi:dihydrodipicolinate synthase/N-acetylneuraminate lyase
LTQRGIGAYWRGRHFCLIAGATAWSRNLSPVSWCGATPFTPAGEPDAGRFVAFCRWLLDQGADGLAIFGTTSEANSMSAGEHGAA